MSKKIDWSKSIDIDELEEVQEDLKGLGLLVDGLRDIKSNGTYHSENHALNLVSKNLFLIADKMNGFMESVNYMESLMRENTIKNCIN